MRRYKVLECPADRTLGREVVADFAREKYARLAAATLLRLYRKDGATWRIVVRGRKWRNNHGEHIVIAEEVRP